MHPYGRAALAGIKVAQGLRSAYKKYAGPTRNVKNRGTQTQTPSKRKRSQFAGASSGSYKGRFAKPKRIKQTIEQMCLSQGTHTTVEQYGTLADPDCVFLTHSSGYINEICRSLAYTLMRKIMTKAGFKITNYFAEVAATNPLAGNNPPENSDGLRFVFTTKNAITSSYNNYTYDTVNNQSFNDIAVAFIDLQNRIIDYVRNNLSEEPYKLAVYRRDFTTLTTHWNLAAEMFLEDCKTQIYVTSSLSVQNRTKAALNGEGTSAEQNQTDRVDSQPVKGYLYEFAHADPRVRHNGPSVSAALLANNEFNYMDDNGLKLIRGATYQGATEPFVPKYFANVTKATKILLQPGDIKKTVFTVKFSGKMTNVIKSLAVKQWISITADFSGMKGKCQMIALEELLRTPSTNLITLAYEREIKIGTIVTHSLRQAPMETRLIHEQINNIPA